MKESIKKKELFPKFITIKYIPFTFKLKDFELKDNIEILIENKDQKEKTNIKFLTFKPEKSINKKRSTKNSNFNDGRWNKNEHEQFIQGIALYGNNWIKIKSLIRTRTAIQVRSHGQKFFNKAKLFKDKKLGIDFRLNSINNFNDMIKQIKYANPTYNIVNIFKNIPYKVNDNKKKFKRPKKKYIYNNNLEKEKKINEDQKESIKQVKEIIIKEEQKQLISQEKENNDFFNNQIIINQNPQNINNENNNNLNYISSYDHNNNNIFPNIGSRTNNFINDTNNCNNYQNILKNVSDLNIDNKFPLNDIIKYNNLFNINLYNDFISTNIISISLINSLDQLNNILFSLRIQNTNSIIDKNSISLDNRLKELNNGYNNSPNSPNNNPLFQINNDNNNNNIHNSEK